MDYQAWFNEIQSWYNGYVKAYLTGKDDENIILKRDHSQRVCANMVLLSKALGCSETKQHIAAVIGLLHDVGRFEQYRRWNTFSDARSESHAALGVDVLRATSVLDPVDIPLRKLVLTAVEFHSALHLPDHLSGDTLFFCQLIRDADKLDIFKVVTDYYQRSSQERNTTLELDLVDDAGYNPEILVAIGRMEEVDYRKARNLNDFKLLQAGWVFSLNFPPTLAILRQREYLAKLQAALPQDEAIEALFQQIDRHKIL